VQQAVKGLFNDGAFDAGGGGGGGGGDLDTVSAERYVSFWYFDNQSASIVGMERTESGCVSPPSPCTLTRRRVSSWFPFDRRQRRRFKSSTRAEVEVMWACSVAVATLWGLSTILKACSLTWAAAASTHPWMWLGMEHIS
jgi:hypothetical protein